jgi:twinkle protein
MEDFNFAGHEQCPKCLSKDNLSVYVNDMGVRKEHCETPGCGYTSGYGGYRNVSRFNPPPLEYIPLRGIPKDILEKYGIGKTEDNLLYQLYHEDGIVIGAKVRTPEKDMWFEGSNPNNKLFGYNTVSSYNHLIITEGELDAAAAHFMTRYPTVSIPNGAGGAAKAVKRNLKWIEKFKRVYVCFDNDDAGVNAADEVMQILKPGIGYRVDMTRKDACEYTKADDKEGFKEALGMAQPIGVDAFYTKAKLREQWLAFWSGGTEGGVGTGIDVLDNWGIRLRPGELTSVYAMPAVGKSTLVRQIAANWVLKGLNVLLVPFEEQGIKYFAQVVGMVNQRKLLKEQPKTVAERLALLDSVGDHLHLSTVTMTDSTTKLKDYLEYACRSLDIHLIVFDNITKYTAISSNQTTDIGTVMAYLVGVAQSCNTHVICVSHTSRDKELKDGQAPSMQAGYNSGSIERFSDTVITMGRLPDSNLCTVAVRKDRANNHIGEFDIEFDFKTYTFKGVKHEPVRQQVRATGGGSVPEDATDTEPTQACEDTVHDSSQLQPGLRSGIQGNGTVGGSEGETVEGRHHEVQRNSALATWEPAFCTDESLPTLLPPKFYQYL